MSERQFSPCLKGLDTINREMIVMEIGDWRCQAELRDLFVILSDESNNANRMDKCSMVKSSLKICHTMSG